MSTWTAVTVLAPNALADPIASFLIDRGAPGVQTEDAGSLTRVVAHFAGEAPLAALDTFLHGLAALHPQLPPATVAVATIDDEAWAENWKAHFPPLTIGTRLYVHPPWIDEVPPGRVAIRLDPGMAFGTGQHASTRGCLELLDAALAARPARRVLDLGTGSGILAIAARRLGVPEVWAVDIDADACAVAGENAALNGVSHGLHIVTALEAVTGTFDLVLANLFAAQLIAFAETLAARLEPGGLVIGAGILDGEADAVRAAWTAAGLVADTTWRADGWTALACRRP